MLSSPELSRYFEPGKSMIVGTVDAVGFPLVCRAVGLVVDPGAQAVTVYLPLATAAKSVANIATNGRIAISVSDVGDHSTLQLKGSTRGVRVAGAGDEPRVRSWHEAFVERVGEGGMAKRVMRGLTVWPAFAIDVDVNAVYEQSPGPRAGALVKSR